MPQSCSPKLLPQCYNSANLFTKTAPQNILQSGSRKLRPKIATESCSPKLLFFKAIVRQSCSGKLAKAAPQSCFPKQLPEAASQSCTPKHLCKAVAPKLLCFKPVPQGGSPKLFSKEAPESCSAKLLPKAAPPKFRSKASSQSCSPKLLHKAVPQSRSPKSLSRAAPNSCSPKLLKRPQKLVSESSFPKLLSKATPQSCRSSKQLFVNAAARPQSCSPQLFPKAATESRVPKKFPKTTRTGKGSKHSVCDRRPVQQAGSLAEVRVRKRTETIAQKLGKQGQ